MGTMLKLEKVTKIYPGTDFRAVDELSFELEEGEICTVVGPSGCGKTTAMKMINRLHSITSGKIYIDGQDVSSLDTIQLRRRIGYVIQNIGLFPNMTIAENISVIPHLLKWDKNKIKERVHSLLDIVNLSAEEYMDRYPRELSGGQQQRIGVARGMAGDPPIMLMDEPFGAIDPINREHLQNEFLKIQEKVKKTIVFVTHDIDEAIKMGDKICLLQDGKLIQFASPEEMLTHPKNEFVSDFVGGDRTIKRLNLFSLSKVMRTDPPVARETATLNEARELLSGYGTDHLVVVDENNRLTGMAGKKDLEKSAETLSEVVTATDSFLESTASLKDGLSEIFTHEAGFLVVVDGSRKVVGWLTTDDIKRALQA
ncbi:MAG: betaine/proline/choline family ABC transporter ATP-binding protein [Desulfobacteraceae bacterium]